MTQLTTKQLAAAREWLCDCTWADSEPEEFAVMSATDIKRGIARFFQGGITAFIETCNPTEPTPPPDHGKDASTATEAHEAAPARRKRRACARYCSVDTPGPTMETTQQINLFGQYQPTPIKGRQLPLFHEPVEAPIPDTRPAIDKRIARKFDEAATPMMFPAPPAKPGEH